MFDRRTTKGRLAWGLAFFAGVAILVVVGRFIPLDVTTAEVIQALLAVAGIVIVTKLARDLRRPVEGEQPVLPPGSDSDVQDTESLEGEQKTAPVMSRTMWTALIVLALMGSASFVRFGHFHFPQFLHNWDLYHYYLGARYFEELGYYDLYRCTLEADDELGARMAGVRSVRNLHDLRITTRRELLDETPSCRDRFAPGRWSEFKEDLQFFREITPERAWRNILRDKGYNGTPSWTVYVGQLAAWAGTDRGRLTALCALDEALIVLALLGVLWAFGPRVFLISALFVGINFATRFQHLGGSLLRLDWLASLVLALCCLKKERWALSGVFLAHATIARVFPLLFLLGILFKVAWSLVRERRIEGRYLRFGAGFGAAVVLLGLLGAAGPRGPQGWSEFGENILAHSSAPASKRVGLKYIILPLRDPTSHLDESQLSNLEIRERWDRRKPIAWAIAAMALVLMFLGARRMKDHEVYALGVVPVFFLLAPTRYYWAMLFVPVVLWSALKKRWQVEAMVMLFAMQALLYAVNNGHRLGFMAERVEDEVLANMASWCLVFIFGHVLWSVSKGSMLSWWRGKKSSERTG